MKQVKHYDFWRFTLSIGSQEWMLGYYHLKLIKYSLHMIHNSDFVGVKFCTWSHEIVGKDND